MLIQSSFGFVFTIYTCIVNTNPNDFKIAFDHCLFKRTDCLNLALLPTTTCNWLRSFHFRFHDCLHFSTHKFWSKTIVSTWHHVKTKFQLDKIGLKITFTVKTFINDNEFWFHKPLWKGNSNNFLTNIHQDFISSFYSRFSSHYISAFIRIFFDTLNEKTPKKCVKNPEFT
jgi:hypothetical protein